MPLEFSFCTTNLITFDVPVLGPAGLVYSTNPHKAEGENGRTYFVKGPEPEMVFAEIAGCMLAAAMGIPVAPVALCNVDGKALAGSEKVEQAFRDASVPLQRPQKCVNFHDLYNVIVIDAWLANGDRNLGNVLAAPGLGDRVQLVMIDFEKSVALRRHPRTKSNMVEYKKLWPSGILSTYAVRNRPLHPPQPIIEKIRAITAGKCVEILGPLIKAFGAAGWADDSIDAITSRAKDVQKIAEAVWRSI